MPTFRSEVGDDEIETVRVEGGLVLIEASDPDLNMACVYLTAENAAKLCAAIADAVKQVSEQTISKESPDRNGDRDRGHADRGYRSGPGANPMISKIESEDEAVTICFSVVDGPSIDASVDTDTAREWGHQLIAAANKADEKEDLATWINEREKQAVHRLIRTDERSDAVREALYIYGRVREICGLPAPEWSEGIFL